MTSWTWLDDFKFGPVQQRVKPWNSAHLQIGKKNVQLSQLFWVFQNATASLEPVDLERVFLASTSTLRSSVSTKRSAQQTTLLRVGPVDLLTMGQDTGKFTAFLKATQFQAIRSLIWICLKMGIPGKWWLYWVKWWQPYYIISYYF